MDEKWKVSRVELLEGRLLFGFVLYDQKGRPSVSFGYADRAKAKAGPQWCCGGTGGRRVGSRSVGERANSERQEGVDLPKKG